METFEDKLNRIVAKPYTEWTKDDVIFLTARRAYLTQEQLANLELMKAPVQVAQEVALTPTKPSISMSYNEKLALARSLGHKIKHRIKESELDLLIS